MVNPFQKYSFEYNVCFSSRRNGLSMFAALRFEHQTF